MVVWRLSLLIVNNWMRNFDECKNNLAKVKDQYNSKIFYAVLVKNISTNMNHVWETEGYTPIWSKSLLIIKNVPSVDDLMKKFNNIFNKRSFYFKTKQEPQRISHNKGFFKKIFNARIRLSRDNEVHMRSQKCIKFNV